MYTAKKPCRFGDSQFYIGDQIPDELVDKNRAATLINYGIIDKRPELASDGVSGATLNTHADAESPSQGVQRALNGNPDNTGKKATAKKGVK